MRNRDGQAIAKAINHKGQFEGHFSPIRRRAGEGERGDLISLKRGGKVERFGGWDKRLQDYGYKVPRQNYEEYAGKQTYSVRGEITWPMRPPYSAKVSGSVVWGKEGWEGANTI